MNEQTTVTIDRKTAVILDRLAKSNDVSKKEFLSCALEYFEKYGINPVQHESPAKEMQKLIKRCDQVIAFIRKQEQDILRPACAATYSSFWAEPPSRNGKRSCILASSLTQRRKAVFSTTLRHCTRSRDKSL